MNDLLTLLVATTAAISIATVGAVIVRTPIRKFCGARAAYYVWLIVPIVALGSVLPVRTANLPAPILLSSSAVGLKQIVWEGSISTTINYAPIFLGVWAIGFALSLLWAILGQQRFTRMADAGLAGPAVVGIVFPRVVLPSDFHARFTADERRMILAHERTHLAYGDAIVTGIIALIQCFQWFNPLAYWAAYLARLDQELACDTEVMARFPGERLIYANAMLKSQNAATLLPFGCSWRARSIHPLEERLAMLNHIRPSQTWRSLGIMLVAVLALSSGYMAFAAQAANSQIVETSANLSRAPSAQGLTMRLVDEKHALGSKQVATFLKPEMIVSGNMVADARASVGQRGDHVISVRLTAQGAQRLAAATRDNTGHRLAILVDGQVIFAPVIREPINDGKGELSGDFTAEEADALVVAIMRGRT